jgi:hypothetical protein
VSTHLKGVSRACVHEPPPFVHEAPVYSDLALARPVAVCQFDPMLLAVDIGFPDAFPEPHRLELEQLLKGMDIYGYYT